MAASARVEASTPKARRRMQRLRQENTSAEAALRRELHASGIRYRIYGPLLTKTRRVADVAFSGLRVAVFVDCCFWHGCPRNATWPTQKAEFWRTKSEANMARDNDTDERLRAVGWKVIRVWAHEEPKSAAGSIAYIRERSRERMRRA